MLEKSGASAAAEATKRERSWGRLVGVRTAAGVLPLVLALTASLTPATAQDRAVSETTSGGPTLNEVIGHSSNRLRYGMPAQAGLIQQYADQVLVDAKHGSDPGTGADGHPEYPGSVVLAARNGVVAENAAAGYNLRYADQQGDELPRDQWIPTTKDTIYDLASLSKLFTTIVAMHWSTGGDCRSMRR